MGELRDSGFPKGTWYHISLPLGTTANELSAWFRERGIDIPSSHVSVKENRHNASVIVCVPKATILTLLTWAINGEPFRGYCVKPKHMGVDRA